MTFTKTLSFFLFFSPLVQAQKTFSSKPEWPKSNYFISYYGNLAVNPGLNAGLEYGISENVKTKTRNKRGNQTVKYKTNRLEVVPNLGFYLDPKGHSAVFEKINIQYKRINNHRRTFTLALGLGYYHSLLQNVYVVDEDFNATEKGLKINTYFAPEIKVGFVRLKTPNQNLRGWYSNISSQFLFHYNHTILPLPAIELGYRFK